MSTAPSRGALGWLFDALERAGDAAVALDARQRILLWNTGAERLLGWRREQVVGRACFEVLAGRDRSGHLVCCAHCPEMVMAERGEPIPARDVCYRSGDGRDVWVNVSTLVITAPLDGQRVTVHLFRDITTRRRAEDVLDALAARAGLDRESSPLRALTRRELEVLEMLAQGLDTRAVARALFVSPVTVRTHVQNLLRKLGAHTRAEAVAVAARWGLIAPGDGRGR
ncbi:MAG: LuxR C-terminal-related transcriptional regulator [Armatimonadota bacterium]|nr:LuxR C-terminal-related transcriptional regulator [Armatimonadota bacterium]MDR7486017.1 LuxR C-terminal-related transcriptional regulator [Armatimonadota bacterium]MDR7532588.1 LuxR C-terminal-related transcriptional regulator [Armatimonadota bacterium]MDR7536203.1 LuxR C-terminal-related transcriptional regulator [Armatimonadota bacterium]